MTSAHPPSAHRGLTPREEEIVRLAADGRSSRVIADSLNISARTVDNHLSIAYQKLGSAHPDRAR